MAIMLLCNMISLQDSQTSKDLNCLPILNTYQTNYIFNSTFKINKTSFPHSKHWRIVKFMNDIGDENRVGIIHVRCR